MIILHRVASLSLKHLIATVSHIEYTNIEYTVVIKTAGMWHHQAVKLVKEIGKRTTNITGDERERDLLLVLTDVHSTAEGECGLISKYVHY